MRAPLLLCLIAISNAAQALKCYSSSAASGEAICPADRSAFCIKEESTTSRGECGSVDPHRFDVWDKRLGKCAYRKCAGSCPGNGTVTTFGDARQYERSTYCCASDRCNGGSALGPGGGTTALVTALSTAVLAFLFR